MRTFLAPTKSASCAAIVLATLQVLAACNGGDASSPETTSVLTVNQTIATSTAPLPSSALVTVEQVGELLFFDKTLSEPAGQSCASCHAPHAGFADPNHASPTSEGAVGGRFGKRNAPTASYAAFVPPRRLVTGPNGVTDYAGGLFLDGRVDTLEDQAQAPLLNNLEMNNPDKASVVNKVRAASYAANFQAVFGVSAFDNIDNAFAQIAQAIAVFERSQTLTPFTAKFDAVQRGLATFTAAEQNGRQLFNSKAQCNVCHATPRGSEVFSNFVYHNIGAPASPGNPFLYLDSNLNPQGVAFVDLGLGAVVDDVRENGKFRTPSLRNVALTAPYMHNGALATLTDVVNFYNRRDIDRIAPEVDQNVFNGAAIGNLGLTATEIQDLIAFLNTLTDGYIR